MTSHNIKPTNQWHEQLIMSLELLIVNVEGWDIFASKWTVTSWTWHVGRVIDASGKLRPTRSSPTCLIPQIPWIGSLIHGGFNFKLTRLEGSFAKVLVPYTASHLQRSCGIHALKSQSCFECTGVIILDRWFSCPGWYTVYTPFYYCKYFERFKSIHLYKIVKFITSLKYTEKLFLVWVWLSKKLWFVMSTDQFHCFVKLYSSLISPRG